MRGDQVARLIKLLLLLGARKTGETVSDLAAALNVSVRTVYRDLEALQVAGVPLVSEREGELTVWRLLDADTWKLGIPLTLAEMLSLHVAAAALKAQGAGAWAEALGSALDKIDAAVPGRLVARLTELVGSVSVSKRGDHAYDRRGGILETVTRALYDRRPLDMHYATPGRLRPVQRRVEPYDLRMHDKGLYLVARDGLRGAVRTFLVDRIRMATPAEGYVEIPEGFDSDRYFASAFGVHRGGPVIHLEARVAPSVAHLLEERTWHPSQRVERRADGATVTLDVADTPELRAWIRSFGPEMVVLAPSSLASAIVADAERVVRKHAVQRAKRGASPSRSSRSTTDGGGDGP